MISHIKGKRPVIKNIIIRIVLIKSGTEVPRYRNHEEMIA